MSEPTREQLVAVQMREWPNSQLIKDDAELADTISRLRGGNRQHQVREYRQAYPNGVAYTVVDGMGHPCVGLRFGLESQDYISF